MKLNDRFAHLYCCVCGVRVEGEEDRDTHHEWHNELERFIASVKAQLKLEDYEDLS